MSNWYKITNDPTVLSWINGYRIPFISLPIQENCPSIYSDSIIESYDYEKSIAKLLKIGAIYKCSHENFEFLSRIFLVPKPNGEKRLILNLKRLNKYIKKDHFKMEDYRTASKLITKNCYMASLDLKDAYFLININKYHRKFLRFMYNGRLYEFTCLPFGLCTAPYVFTKLLKPVIEYIRSKYNILSVIYLDDLLCFGETFQECQNNVHNIKKLLISLGFIINTEKSSLTPKRQCKFLGFVYDSKNMFLQLPDDKKYKVKEILLTFVKLTKCKLRDFARFIGLLISVCPAVEYSWLHTKQFEYHKYMCLLKNSSYDQIINVPDSLKPDINWWLANIENSYCLFRFNNYNLEIFSDASLTGWGGYCGNKKVHGFWKLEESCLHINELELKAAFFTLKVFTNNLYGKEILLRIDNTTAISCINRMGSVQYPHLYQISKDIWKWCEMHKLYIFASYINTKDNTVADSLSRKKFQDTEWELADYAFQKILLNFGDFDIDLFASRCNAKCKKYITWKRDPDALAVDAFTVSWKNIFFYAFPPFILILKVLRKIISDKAEGVLVVPYWPTQPWFPLFDKLICSPCVYFEPNVNLLTSPFRSSHSLHQTLCLVAAKLSGKHI